MNAGDRLTIAAITQYGNVSVNKDAPATGTVTGYFHGIGARIYLWAYCAQFLGYCQHDVQKYISGSWTSIANARSEGTDGGTVARTYDIGTGYFRGVAYTSAGHSYTRAGYTAYRSYSAPRTADKQLRTMASDFSAYEAAGTSQLTATLANAGRICTY